MEGSMTMVEAQPARASKVVSALIGSEILKIAGEIRSLVAEGRKVCNLTVGDFNSAYFPIPELLKERIELALERGETNYPPSDGILPLRLAIQEFYRTRLGLDYPLESIVVTGGARPGIYAAFATVVDPGDVVVYPTPSWNNNHYSHLTGAVARPVNCDASTQFLPTAEMLEESIGGARLLALCSPLNPSGTMFRREDLLEICQLVLAENKRRQGSERPLYLLYDQVYWLLTFGTRSHQDPVSLLPDLAPYTIYIDGISKAFAATGLRLGWVVGPSDIARRMSGLLGHIGAWAPKPEQFASAAMLSNEEAVQDFQKRFRTELEARLRLLFDAIEELQHDGYAVEAIPPMGAIYLSARFDLLGKKTSKGEALDSNEAIRRYLLEEAQIAVVPFQAFGVEEDNGWFRLSVGAVSMEDIREAIPRLRAALDALQ